MVKLERQAEAEERLRVLLRESRSERTDRPGVLDEARRRDGVVDVWRLRNAADDPPGDDDPSRRGAGRDRRCIAVLRQTLSDAPPGAGHRLDVREAGRQRL